MGCDIHFNVESRRHDRWHYEGKLYDGRNYTLFGQLAGVRDFEAEPVAPPRGIPNDASYETRKSHEDWGDDGHTPSWLTLGELKAYRDSPRTAEHSGLVEAGTYDRWKIEQQQDPDAFPSSWCQGTSAPTMPEAAYLAAKAKGETPNVYVGCAWGTSVPASAKNFWRGTVSVMEKIAEAHGLKDDEVRCVFWFDN